MTTIRIHPATRPVPLTGAMDEIVLGPIRSITNPQDQIERLTAIVGRLLEAVAPSLTDVQVAKILGCGEITTRDGIQASHETEERIEHCIRRLDDLEDSVVRRRDFDRDGHYTPLRNYERRIREFRPGTPTVAKG